MKDAVTSLKHFLLQLQNSFRLTISGNNSENEFCWEALGIFVTGDLFTICCAMSWPVSKLCVLFSLSHRPGSDPLVVRRTGVGEHESTGFKQQWFLVIFSLGSARKIKKSHQWTGKNHRCEPIHRRHLFSPHQSLQRQRMWSFGSPQVSPHSTQSCTVQWHPHTHTQRMRVSIIDSSICGLHWSSNWVTAQVSCNTSRISGIFKAENF